MTERTRVTGMLVAFLIPVVFFLWAFCKALSLMPSPASSEGEGETHQTNLPFEAGV